MAALAAGVGLPAVSDLLIRALTHSSFAHEHPPAGHNETLAFLGDAVLGLAVTDLLVRRAPGATPGTLTVQRAEVVSTGGLAAWARALGVGACLRLGPADFEGPGWHLEAMRGALLVLGRTLERLAVDGEQIEDLAVFVDERR